MGIFRKMRCPKGFIALSSMVYFKILHAPYAGYAQTGMGYPPSPQPATDARTRAGSVIVLFKERLHDAIYIGGAFQLWHVPDPAEDMARNGFWQAVGLRNGQDLVFFPP